MAIVNLLPLSGWQSTRLAVDLPIGVAAGLVLSPLETGLVAFLGAFDSAEFTGRTTPTKALFNRSQAALVLLAGSWVAHGATEHPGSSDLVLLLAFASLTTGTALNYLLVSAAVSLEHGHKLVHVLRRLRLGTFTDFALTFVAWGVLGAMLAALYQQIQAWALLAFLGPALLGRQVLLRSQMFIDTRAAYRSREDALREISKQTYKERLDERRLIAADLHDEVLQPLFKVTLMAHVLKADIASGRLLELEDDLPELVTAAELASTTLRELIGDLRRSSLGRAGLAPALATLVDGYSKETSIHFETELQDVNLDPTQELALYQIAKEALTNSVSHSRAANIWVELRLESSTLELTVRDDGVGFDPSAERSGHYGLEIMRERATAIGADLWIDATPSGGSCLRVLMPLPTPQT